MGHKFMVVPKKTPSYQKSIIPLSAFAIIDRSGIPLFGVESELIFRIDSLMFGGFISAIQQFALAGFGILNDIGMLRHRLFCKITSKAIVVFVIKEKLIEEGNFFKFYKEKMNKLFHTIIPIIDSIYGTTSDTFVLTKNFKLRSTQKRIVKSLETSVNNLFS